MINLPDLPYSYNALEPIISSKIMKIHHEKHHATYVANLNKAIDGTIFESMPVENVLKNLSTIPVTIRTSIQNNGGGHVNHSFFWKSMRSSREVNHPTEKVSMILSNSFGSVEKFKQEFTKAGLTRFGSGWVWLVKKQNDTLAIYSTANQDSPLSNGDRPILTVDVWEHAYYLDYFNDRAKYLQEWWKVVNWDEIEILLTQ